MVAAENCHRVAGRAGLGRWTRPALRFQALSHQKLGHLREALDQVDLALPMRQRVGCLRSSTSSRRSRRRRWGPTGTRPITWRPREFPTPRRRKSCNEAGWRPDAPCWPWPSGASRTWSGSSPRRRPLVVGLKAYDSMSETGWLLAEVGLSAAAERMEIARAAGDVVAEERIRATVPVMTGWVEQVDRRARFGRRPGLDWTENYEGLIAGHVARIEGHDDPGLWQAVADRFTRRSIECLTARYRQAEAMLATRAPRDEVRSVMAVGHAAAVEDGAQPLARRFEELARRARIDLASRPRATARQSKCRRRTSRHRPARRPSGPWPERTRGRGAHACRRGLFERRDCRAPVHQQQDRQRPRLAHPRQARRLDPDRGGDDRRAAGPARGRRRLRVASPTPTNGRQGSRVSTPVAGRDQVPTHCER